MSLVYNFTTPLPSGDPTPYNFIYYGDMGIYDAGRKCAQNMIEDMVPKDIKHIFHNGDISYARGHVSLFMYLIYVRTLIDCRCCLLVCFSASEGSF